MKLEISKSNTIQYFLLYLAILTQRTPFWDVYGSNGDVFIILLCVGMCVLKRVRIPDTNLLGIGVLMGVLLAERFLVGGVGLNFMIHWLSRLLIVNVFYYYNSADAARKYVKLTYCMSVISLIFFVIAQINMDILTQILKPVLPGSNIHGMLLYSLKTSVAYRNNGIFNEPGIYQILLSTALFVLMFYPNLVGIDEKQRVKYIIVILITLVTGISTTGYVAAGIVIIGFVLYRQKFESLMKQRILLIAFIAIIVLAIDYQTRQSDSFLQAAVFNKMFDENMNMNLMVSTGQYRMYGIERDWKIFLQNPLGVGFDKYGLMRADVEAIGATNAGLIYMLATLGVVVTTVAILCQFGGLLLQRGSFMIKLVLLLIYVNTIMAQNNIVFVSFYILALICSNATDQSLQNRYILEGEIIE